MADRGDAPRSQEDRDDASRLKTPETTNHSEAGEKTPPEGSAAPAKPIAETYLLHVSRKAMACEFQVFFNAGQYANATEAALESLDLIDSLEAQMSYFRATSEIGKINCLACDGPVAVEPRLFALLQMAADLYTETDGAVDITSTPLWETWGFARRAGRIPDEDELAQALARVGGNCVALDAERQTVRFTKPGVQINLGCVGKGYALDRAAELLAEAKIHDYMFHGGQSSVLVRGARMLASPDDPDKPMSGWSVGLPDPLRPEHRLGVFHLQDRALGTSGATIQFFRHRGKRYGHIINPRTGRPAEGVLSTTVLAPTAALADGLSTAFFVMGPDRTAQYCEKHPGIAAILICQVIEGQAYEVRSFGFGPGELQLRAEN
jgi:thiamine biosynthesis lipoprotein